MQTKIFALTCLVVVISACRAGFETGDFSPDDPDDDEVSLSQLQRDIFTPNCAGCHTGANAPGNGLRLDSVSNTFNTTVNIRSNVSGISRVSPNDANNSYLVQKIEGGATISGARMPLNNAPLSRSDIDNIRRWIDNGASQSRASSEPTQIISKSDAVVENVYRIELVFGRELDAAVLLPSNLVMDIQYADYSLTASPSRLEVAGKRLSAWLELEGAPVAIATVFNHPSAPPILDMAGRAVDGDGDRSEGGQFVFKSTQALSAMAADKQ